jgi:hypothetical protein
MKLISSNNKLFTKTINTMQKTTWSEKTEKELYDQAVAAFYRKHNKDGVSVNQPNEGLSEVDEEIVHLNNVNGPLAKYNYKTQRFVD